MKKIIFLVFCVLPLQIAYADLFLSVGDSVSRNGERITCGNGRGSSDRQKAYRCSVDICYNKITGDRERDCGWCPGGNLSNTNVYVRGNVVKIGKDKVEIFEELTKGACHWRNTFTCEEI